MRSDNFFFNFKVSISSYVERYQMCFNTTCIRAVIRLFLYLANSFTATWLVRLVSLASFSLLRENVTFIKEFIRDFSCNLERNYNNKNKRDRS